MKVVICDADATQGARFSGIVQDLAHRTIACVQDTSALIAAIKKHAPEIVIVNEQVMDALQALTELANTSNLRPAVIVYGTGLCALQAVQLGAYNYLLSPVSKSDIAACIDRACVLNAAQLHSLQKSTLSDRRHICARTHRGLELILLSDVYYFCADQKYVKVCHKGGIVLIDETLKDLEDEFGKLMFRIHRNALINLDYLDLLESLDKGRFQVRLRGVSEALAVSRRHLPALREKIYHI